MYVKSIQSPGNAIVISPAWFNLNFIYYYNRELFKITNHLNDSLEAHSIYSIDNISNLNKEIIQTHKSIIYIDCGSEFTDPEHKIPEYLKSSLLLDKTQEIPEKLTVYSFRK